VIEDRAARLANRYVITSAAFQDPLATASDAVDKKVYDGPVSKDEALRALKAMSKGCKLQIAA